MAEAIIENMEPLQCLLCGELRHRPIFNEFGIDILALPWVPSCLLVFCSQPSL